MGVHVWFGRQVLTRRDKLAESGIRARRGRLIRCVRMPALGDVFRVLNEMRAEGVVSQYAIGGATAVLFYADHKNSRVHLSFPS